MICLREMNVVEVDEESGRITLGGGTIVKELIEAATAKKLEVSKYFRSFLLCYFASC